MEQRDEVPRCSHPPCASVPWSRQPGGVSLWLPGEEARSVHTNSQGQLTPTRTTFIPPNYLLRGAAIKRVSAATAA